jgi:hypothetical protein
VAYVASSATGVLLEIACDESGYEGEKLIGTTTDVFAHGSVGLDVAAAARCMRELRDRIRSPATEYKANHILREKHRAALEWTLGPSGPLLGHAHVYLIDKEHYVLSRLAGLLLDDGVGARAARALRRDGRPGWDAFLAAANDLMRGKDRPDVSAPVDAFFRTLDALGPDGEVVRRLRQARPRAESLRARLLDDPALSVLDPLIPAIVRAVAHWGRGGRAVSVVHDQTNTLRPERIARLEELLGDRLAGFRLTDSFTDPRVQAADLLAGAARRIAQDALHGRGDSALTALLRPYVDLLSIWGDAASWSLIAPLPQTRSA